MVDGSADPERYPLTPWVTACLRPSRSWQSKASLRPFCLPQQSPANQSEPRQGYRGLQEVGASVSFDYVLSETASISHYILPESYYLERDDVVHNNHCYSSKQVAIRQAVINPVRHEAACGYSQRDGSTSGYWPVLQLHAGRLE